MDRRVLGPSDCLLQMTQMFEPASNVQGWKVQVVFRLIRMCPRIPVPPKKLVSFGVSLRPITPNNDTREFDSEVHCALRAGSLEDCLAQGAEIWRIDLTIMGNQRAVKASFLFP